MVGLLTMLTRERASNITSVSSPAVDSIAFVSIANMSTGVMLR